MAMTTSRGDFDHDLVVAVTSRIVELFDGYAVTYHDRATLLRQLADTFEPSGLRACDVCRALFEPNRSDKRYCGNACKQRAWRIGISRNER
jgi:hypothetical protein